MSIGSLSSTTVPTSAFPSADASAQAVRPQGTSTIADHVAAADEHEPIRSVSTTQGTLVDTYL
jgi:hypothetical protein